MTTLQLSRAKAAEELLNRRKARASLLAFTQYTWPGYRAEPAHALIAGALDKVMAGHTRRLMIFAPPQHGKSELASVRLPAYWLGRKPDDPVILCSYAADLAQSKSRRAREIVESAEYAALFPEVKTQVDSRAVGNWLIADQRGELLASGVGGPITGHGAMLGIVDDPIENWEQAQSETIRERVWDWYKSTFRTRVWEDGAIVLIMTRWHEADLAGKLLAAQAGEWTVLRLPARAETQQERNAANRRLGLPLDEPDPLGRMPGEPLCPRRFSSAALASIQRDVYELVWQSEYQGVPTQAEGSFFRRLWFGSPVEAAPAGIVWVRYWDLAASERESGDYTVGARCGFAPDGMLWIADIVRGRWEWPDAQAIVAGMAKLDGPGVAVGLEGIGVQRGFRQTLLRQPDLRNIPLIDVPVLKDKQLRARAWQSRAQTGKVVLVRGPWNEAFLNEIMAFPAGAHDDQVDAVSGAVQMLSQVQRIRDLTVTRG